MRKVLISILMLTFLISGCASESGTKIKQAIIKSISIETAKEQIDLTFSMKINSDKFDKNIKIINNLLNNIKLSMYGEINNNKLKAIGNLKSNGLTAEYELYIKDNISYFKLPLVSNYFSLDNEKYYDFSKDEYKLFEQKLETLLIEYLNNYIKDYNFELKNIKSNGIINVQTANGAKDLNEYVITLDNEQTKGFISYAIKQVLQKPETVKLIIDILKFEDKENIIDKEYEEALKSTFKTALDSFDTTSEMAYKYFDINEKGTVIKMYIDQEGYPVKMDFSTELKVYPPSYDSSNKQSIDIKFGLSNDTWDINKPLDIKFPEFTKDNTITFEELIGSEMPTTNPLKLEIERYKKEKNRKNISELYIGSDYAYIRGTDGPLQESTFAKGGVTYIAAQDAAKIVGATFSQKGNIITISSSKAKITFNTKAKGTNAVIIKNKVAMVPLKLVVTKFGKKIIKGQYSSMITIE